MTPDVLPAFFDWLLAAMLVALGLVSVFSRSLIGAISAFIALGLVLAMAWARLGAPDLALAEVVIGAGILGGLLLRAWSGHATSSAGHVLKWPAGVTPLALLVTAVPVAAVAAGMVLVGVVGPSAPGPVPDMVLAAIDATGVSHPVTAVLLDYRAFDTLLELGVLLAATVSAMALGGFRPAARTPGHALRALLRWVVPLLVLAAGILLWRGAFAPGGAFQAGASLGAALILVLLGWGVMPVTARWIPIGLAAGVGVFTVLGVLAGLAGGVLFDWPAPVAGALILAIEAAATVSIACALALLFVGGRPEPADEDPTS